MTNLENAVFSHPAYLALGEKPDKKAVQKVLDNITDEILSQFVPYEILRHVEEVYNDTVEEYLANPHTKYVIDELVEFMAILPDNARVLDLGCGPGRDALFMASCDLKWRKSLMGKKSSDGKTTLDKFPVPTKTFRVHAMDSSNLMIATALKKETELIQKGILEYGGRYSVFTCFDMHQAHPHYLNSLDGVWSCTALFTHTPHELMESGMGAVARQLKFGGIFFTSYTNSRADGRFNKLLLSGTGRIKYFSQPDPETIAELAQNNGLKLIKETFSDMTDKEGNIIKKDLFTSQFYQKR